MKHILAIDIGNTKTEYILGNQEGVIQKRYKSEGANYQAKGLEKCYTILSKGLEKLFFNTKYNLDNISFIYIGAAGADSESDYNNLHLLFTKLFKKIPFAFENDGMISLKNGIIDEPGLVITCGTGNINYAQNRKGEKLRLGGYCMELGDKLGSETIAKYIASDCARSFDHRDYASIMPGLLIKDLKLDNYFDLMEMDLESEIATTIIKAFLKACDLFDGKALEICWTLTKEVITIVEFFHKNLLLTEKKFRVVLDGYIFNTDNPFVKMIKNSLHNRYPIELVLPTTPPVFGAFYYALEKINIPLTKERLEKLKLSYKKEIS